MQNLSLTDDCTFRELKMAENKIKDNKLEKVAGGADVIFSEGTTVCPICGKMDIKLIASEEFTDTYKCEMCGQQSTHTKKQRPAEPKIHENVSCPMCRHSGEWRLKSRDNGIDTIVCKICGLEMTVPAE